MMTVIARGLCADWEQSARRIVDILIAGSLSPTGSVQPRRAAGKGIPQTKQMP